MSNLSFLNSNNFTALSFSEKDSFLNHVDRFIDMIDLESLNEIMGACGETDIDKLFNIIIEETNEILNLKNYNKSLSSLNSLPSVKAGYEEYLRKQNLNYFVSSVLPTFEMNWHNIEWFSMIQLYRLLCIMAARDHSKSYSMSFAYVLWRLYRYTRPTALITPPDDIRYFKEGMLITNEFKLAKRLLKKVKEEIQVNDFLKDVLVPDKNSGGWANESLTCKNGAELTLSSFRTSNRGPHPGWIVVDDFLDKSAIYSKEQREKFIDVFNSEIMNMILPQGQVITVGCVGLDTIVLTKGGFSYMKDLVPDYIDLEKQGLYDFQTQLLDREGWSSTSKYFVNGFGKMKRVVLRGGYSLDCSLVHPLYKMSKFGSPEWVRSSELKVGDWVGLKRNRDVFGGPISLKEFKKTQVQYCYNIVCLRVPDYLDEDLAYLVGLWIAEGSMSIEGGSVEISTGDPEIELFLYSLKEKYEIRFRKVSDFSYVCVSKNLINLFTYLGLSPTRCNKKMIPPQLMLCEKKILKNLLSGLFDGDGSCCIVNGQNIEVSLSSTSTSLINSVQSFLLMGWGLKSMKNEVSLEKLRDSLKEGDFNCNFSQLSLTLCGNSAIEFCREIGFRLSRKQGKFFNFRRYVDRDLVPFQYQLYETINRKRLKNRVFYDKSKPKILDYFYQKKKSTCLSKRDLINIVTYWESLGISGEELRLLKENCREDIIWVPIKSIEDIEGYSVDFVIPETHSFITNGIISHNTPFHERDLYYVLKNSPEWRVFEYPGVFPDGSLLWENRYNFEALKNKRISLGSMIFSREILVRPISDTTSIFPYTILEKSFVGMRDFTLVKNIQSYKVKFKKIGTGVDLALSSSVGADYTVICTVGIDESDKIHLLNVVRLKGASYNEQISYLKRVNLDFDPSVILMETNGFQKIMADLSKEYGITNIAEWVTKGNNKKDLYEGLPSLAVFFERDEIKLPRGDEYSLEMTNLLCSELNSIAFDDTKGTLESVSEHDDFAMAFFLAIKSLKYVNNIFRINMIG